jgi:hypothetical protein
MDTLFGLVKEGMQLLAVAWKPYSVKDRVLESLWIPEERYSWSKPSTQTTVAGLEGRVYCPPWSVNDCRDSAIIDTTISK